MAETYAESKRPWLRSLPEPAEPKDGGDVTEIAFREFDAFKAWLDQEGGSEHPLGELISMQDESVGDLDLMKLWEIMDRLAGGGYAAERVIAERRRV